MGGGDEALYGCFYWPIEHVMALTMDYSFYPTDTFVLKSPRKCYQIQVKSQWVSSRTAKVIMGSDRVIQALAVTVAD